MISTRRLTKTFGQGKRIGVTAVSDVSLEVKPGEIYGLLGANGAGKTTLLRILATLLTPSGGEAEVGGYSVATEPVLVRARVGFLSASGALYGRLTAREVIAYFGALHGIDGPVLAGRIAGLADRLDMHGFLDRRCDDLSTGMRQKTSIARSLVHDPAVMIFDEPTLGLDVMTARSVVAFVRECGAAGKTVIYSTHTMYEVEKICDRVGIIEAGRIVAEGTLNELRAQTGRQDVEDVFVAVTGKGVGPC